MTEDDFNDFMDSDDDAFFLEASLQDCDEESESLLTNSSAAAKHEDNYSSKFSEFHKTTPFADNNISQASKSDNSSTKINSIISSTAAEIVEIGTETLTLPETSGTIVEVIANNLTKSNTSCSSSSLNTSCSKPRTLYINNRFTPGFTPKAKKRKFPGPAGLFECFDEPIDNISKSSRSKKMLTTMDSDFEHIPSSQFSLEHLSLTSWQKLQADVSSNSKFHSTAKCYSIQRVLHETSKKKLPKLMIVPILCVLLKEKKSKESSTLSVFMDDTDKINAKIDADVLTNYKEYMVEGTAFILQKVTFLFNVLILKSENIVSMYLRDGREKHLQSFESVLDTAESSMSTNSESLKSAHQTNNKTVDSHHKSASSSHSPVTVDRNLNISRNVLNQNTPSIKSSTIVSHKSASNNHRPTINKNFCNSSNVLNQNSLSMKSSTLTSHKNASSIYNPVINRNFNNSKNLINQNTRTLNSSAFASESSVPIKEGDECLEDLLSEDNCFDDFDELLGSMDEKSFQGDL